MTTFINARDDHDAACEAEWESGAMAYTPCGCAHRKAAGVIHDPMPPDHWVVQTFRARCSCGWVSAEVPTREDAAAALAHHSKENAS